MKNKSLKGNFYRYDCGWCNCFIFIYEFAVSDGINEEDIKVECPICKHKMAYSGYTEFCDKNAIADYREEIERLNNYVDDLNCEIKMMEDEQRYD